MTTLKIRKVGNSLGATFPKEVLQKLKLQEGDTVYVTETPDGVQLTPYDPNFDQAMEAYRKVSNKYRNALRQLAE
ncbi:MULTISPECIES: AbrB/MazE/SpoVT family DNA-binding domain-containing protein [unclassified Acaryochloris]|uniref:AbrB/MazE/SpoVT family DNA-binding domain-containing protein n=1 Tax=unclassified Acaryochloris TaxID=2631661 RepID=UPI0002483CE6|nr:MULTISPECIES: AbrB/MazE/SpoVT family DNA-binding domain-containing protein [unclassified Acaryochloris]KAI9131123.1 AbrB/MazE/SpoVT family DNA-binding domain-containing protein [Acaryochloris sp. CCMEE 5410]